MSQRSITGRTNELADRATRAEDAARAGRQQEEEQEEQRRANRQPPHIILDNGSTASIVWDPRRSTNSPYEAVFREQQAAEARGERYRILQHPTRFWLLFHTTGRYLIFRRSLTDRNYRLQGRYTSIEEIERYERDHPTEDLKPPSWFE